MDTSNSPLINVLKIFFIRFLPEKLFLLYSFCLIFLVSLFLLYFFAFLRIFRTYGKPLRKGGESGVYIPIPSHYGPLLGVGVN